MHKPLLASLASDNNSKHFSDLGKAFEGADPPINIGAVGGNEFNGTGVFTLLIDDDSSATIERAVGLANELGFQVQEIRSVTVELANRPGELGRVGTVLDAAGINILSLLVVGIRAGRALVNIGVLEDQLTAAREALTDAGYTVVLGDERTDA